MSLDRLCRGGPRIIIPFTRWKRDVHNGGVADPCIVSVTGREASMLNGPRQPSGSSAKVCTYDGLVFAPGKLMPHRYCAQMLMGLAPWLVQFMPWTIIMPAGQDSLALAMLAMQGQPLRTTTPIVTTRKSLT